MDHHDIWYVVVVKRKVNLENGLLGVFLRYCSGPYIFCKFVCVELDSRSCAWIFMILVGEWR